MFGNESNDAILESWGLKTKPDEINKMQPVQCPNCGESNKIDSKFCAKCRMVLTYDSYQEVTEELETRFTNEEFMILKNISDHFGKIGSDKFNEFLKNNDKEKIRGVKKALNQKGDYVKVGEDKENGVVFVEYTEDEERIKADRMAWKKEHESDESG